MHTREELGVCCGCVLSDRELRGHKQSDRSDRCDRGSEKQERSLPRTPFYELALSPPD
jgi:hypothetical protein